ncbi:MAG TPA: universal stress protein [Steroidobacteraceae bacterium]|nr:universal stress protein [Steroidobacteraceae bacterium]
MSTSHPDSLDLFVVIDPTQEPQPALTQAIHYSETPGVRVHLFVCVFDQAAEAGPEAARATAREHMIERNRNWLDELAKPITERGVPVSLGIEWDRDWREAIVRAARERRPDLVIKSTFKHSMTSRTLFKTSDRLLLRNCGCPVLLVKSATPWTKRKVLGCLEPMPKDVGHGELNEAVMRETRALADRFGFQPHYVLGADTTEDLPTAREMAEVAGVPRAQVHVGTGAAADVIVGAADRLGVDVIVIGTIARRGAAGLMIGNTAERILDRVEVDVLAVPLPGTAEAPAG